MDIFEVRGLLGDRGDDFRMRMAEARNGCSAAGVDVPTSRLINQENAFAADRERRPPVRETMKDITDQGSASPSLLFAVKPPLLALVFSGSE
jgi:hypothetical protein